MPLQPDIVISDRSGATAAAIEVKALTGADAQTAARYLRNLVAHGALPLARFVLLVTPQTGYLWSTPGEILRAAGPSLTFPMERIIEHFMPAAPDSRPVGDLVLESIVVLWLEELTDGIIVYAAVAKSLEDTGFLGAVRGGRVSAPPSMKAYVESGSVVTLALRQNDRQAGEQLLEFARMGRVTLAIPSFSLSEPLATVQHCGNARRSLVDELCRETPELGRTQPHERMAHDLEQYTIELDQVLRTNLEALESVVLEISRGCEMLLLNGGVVARASSYKTSFDRQLPDAIILATTMADFEEAPNSEEAVFISQNVRDFGVPVIQDALQELNCKYLADVANAVRYIRRPTGGLHEP